MDSGATQPRFVVDVMLGRLARWLRLLDYDTAYGNDWDDPRIVRIALREQRIVLSRDHGLLARRSVPHGLLVDSDDLGEQLRIVRRECGIELRADRLFGRCPGCNTPLETVDREHVRGRVPPYVLRTHASFRRCARCEHYYWPGSHTDLAKNHLNLLF